MFPNTRKVIIASAALAVVVSLAAPMEAQGGQREQGGRSSSARGAQRSGGGQARSAPAARAPQAAPQASRGPAPASAAPRQYRGPVVQGPPRSGNFDQGRTPPANYGRPSQALPRYNDYRGGTVYAAPRGYVQQRAVPYRSYSPGYSSYRRPIFVRPYYTFRPRFSVGFGLFAGYGVAYPFQYYDPYAPYNYGIGVVPGYNSGYNSGYAPGYNSGYSSYSNQVGGVSFELDPSSAAVFIDGNYVGVAEDFSPDQMPLTLSVGRHHIDLRADGFLTASFDITIVGGQVIPYQGTMALSQ